MRTCIWRTKDEGMENEENYIIKNSTICIFSKYNFGDAIKHNGRGRTCRMTCEIRIQDSIQERKISLATSKSVENINTVFQHSVRAFLIHSMKR
jgi:hypothetical protein